MNKVKLTGLVATDPEIREAADGTRTASFSVTTRSDENPDELYHDDRTRVSTSYEPFVVFADAILRKGDKVHVEGSLRTSFWVDKQNIERYSTEVVIGPRTGKLELLGDAQESYRPSVSATRRRKPAEPSSR